MYVEINLTKPVIGKVWLRDHWYRVEYEGLHRICSTCGYYGHLTRECTQKREGAENTTPTVADAAHPSETIPPVGEAAINA